MGKRKKRERREAEERARYEAASSGTATGPLPFDPGQLAGLAAAAMQRVNTPEFRQVVTGAMGFAAQAFDRRRPAPPPAAPVPPRAPVPPVPPVPPLPPVPPAAFATEPRSGEAAPFPLPPETAATIDRIAVHAGEALEHAAAIAAQAIGTAAAAVERWAEEQRNAFAAPRRHDSSPED